MNKVFLIGNLTRDVESGTTQNDIAFAKFTIAVSRRGKEKTTDFLNVIAWRGLAEICSNYGKKGGKVAVCGSIQTGSYEKDGQKRYTTDIIADEVEFLSPKNENNDGFSRPEAPARPPHISEMNTVDEDIPF